MKMTIRSVETRHSFLSLGAISRGGSPVLGLSGSLLVALALLEIAAQRRGSVYQSVYFIFAQSVVYLISLACVRRCEASPRSSTRALILVLSVAAVLRGLAVAAPPFFSMDIYSYIWEGRVQAAGINPYLYVPADPHLAPLRDTVIYPNVARAEYARGIYPPAAEMLLFLATRASESVTWMKLVLVAIEAVGIWALIRVLRRSGRSPAAVLLYAWHPLPIWEVAGSGHLDGAAVAFVALACWARIAHRLAFTGAALAAAILVKLLPAILGPALWSWRDIRSCWRLPVTAAAIMSLAYLPYLGAGIGLFSGLYVYAAEQGLQRGHGFFLLEVVRTVLGEDVPAAAYLVTAAIVLVSLALTALRRVDEARPLAWAPFLVLALLVLVSPHYPWYFVWPIAVLCVEPWLPALWPTLSAPLLYLADDTSRIPLWIQFVLYGGIVILDVPLRLLNRAQSA